MTVETGLLLTVFSLVIGVPGYQLNKKNQQLVQQVAAVFGIDTTIYNEQATELFNTVLAIFVLIGVVVDPTTAGTGDSEQALGYNKPRDDLGGDA